MSGLDTRPLPQLYSSACSVGFLLLLVRSKHPQAPRHTCVVSAAHLQVGGRQQVWER